MRPVLCRCRCRFARFVRRHINWNNRQLDLKEDLAHLVQDIKRRICGIASAGNNLACPRCSDLGYLRDSD